jgi:hypothetical protein
MEGSETASRTMRIWIPVALGGLILGSYAVFYALSTSESQGAASIGVANTVGLLAVFVGLIAAGLLMRRAAPHQ